MRLFNLVKQHHAVRPAAHTLAELAAFLVAHITWRRADQAAHTVFLHVLAHVDARHRLLVIKQELRQSPCQFRFAYAGWPEENKTAHRPLRILQPTARAAHRIGHGGHRFILADHSLVQTTLHPDQLLPFALQHSAHRDARPRGHYAGDIVLGHFLAEQATPVLFMNRRLGCCQFLFQLRNAPVLNLCGHRQIARALGRFLIAPRRVDLAVDDARRIDRRLLVPPLALELRRAFLQVGQLLLQMRQSLARRMVLFLLECGLLNLQLQNLAFQLINLHRHRVQLHTQTRGRLIHQIHCLVRQEPVGNIAIRQLRCTHQRAVLNANSVVHLIALLEPAQNCDRLLDRRFLHRHGLEPPLQRRIFLDVLAILIQRRRANTAQFPTRQLRLQHVRRIRRTLGIARADDGVQLVDEQNNLALSRRYFLQKRLQAVLKFTTILRTRNHRAQVHRHDALVLQ